MWYPLKNSVFSLSVASAVLMAVVLLSDPIDTTVSPATDSATIAATAATAASDIDAEAITLGARLLADRLPIEDDREREVARAAFSAASLLLIAKLREQEAQIALDAEAIKAEAKETIGEATSAARAARSGAAMPFFSFGRWVSPGRERGS